MEGFSFSEIVVIIIFAILIYGKDLPQAARKMATLYTKFKRQLSDVREEIRRQIPMDEIQDSLKIDLPSGPGGEPPSAPSLLTASPSDSNVLLTWNSAVGASTYTIRRSNGPQDPWVIVAMNIPELAWTDTDVQPGKTYHYVVSSVNGTGESGNSDEAVALIPGGPATPAADPALATPAPGAASAPAADAAAPAPANGKAEPPAEPAPEAQAAAAAPTNGKAEHPAAPAASADAPQAAPGAPTETTTPEAAGRG